MPSTFDTAYNVRFPLPDMYQRGTVNTLRCAVERDGAVVAPSAASVTVYDAAGAVAFTNGAVANTASVPTTTWTPATTLTYGDTWRTRWVLTLAGVEHVFENEAMLVRNRLACPVVDSDLFTYAALNPSGPDSRVRQANYQRAIDEAWLKVQRWIVDRGRRPDLVISSSATRDAVLERTLAIVFADLAARSPNAPNLIELAKSHEAKAEAELSKIRLVFADPDTGQPTRRRRGGGGVFLGGVG